MKGLILSGGKGTRLRPITHTSAKQLIPVANKPVLFYGIEAIRDSGIKDIGIIVGETRAEIMEAAGNGSKWGVKITYIHQPEPLGLAHAVLTAEEYLDGEQFVMYLGDNLIKDGIAALVEEFERKKPHAMILLAKVSDPRQFGVAELEKGRVVRLAEKPKRPKSNLALVGVYMFDANIFKAAKAIKPSHRGELEITDAIQWLVDSGYDVRPHIVTGWWKDTGKLEDILEANRMILDDLETNIEGKVDEHSEVYFKVVVEKGALIRNSTLRGPAIIGEGAQVINSFIGPFTSIAHGSKVIGSEVEHSILLENCSVVDIKTRIVDSLIGRNAEVSESQLKPKAFRFMLGDYSKVGIF